jgi:hypothetical protein
MDYYIVSLKHTHKYHEHIVFWGPNDCGYTPVVGTYIGTYGEVRASRLNDGQSYIAVPVEAVTALLSPEPYYKQDSKFYDQHGPVVDNTRQNWNALIAARLSAPQGNSVKPKPEVFRGKRRSFALVKPEEELATS